MCVGSDYTGPPGLVMVGDEEGPWTSEQNRESRYLNSTLGMDIRGNDVKYFAQLGEDSLVYSETGVFILQRI